MAMMTCRKSREKVVLVVEVDRQDLAMLVSWSWNPPTRSREKNPHGPRTCSLSPPNSRTRLPLTNLPSAISKWLQSAPALILFPFFNSDDDVPDLRLAILGTRKRAYRGVAPRTRGSVQGTEADLHYIASHLLQPPQRTTCFWTSRQPVRRCSHVSTIPMVQLLHDYHPLSKRCHPCPAMASTTSALSFLMLVCAVANFPDP
ncbi:uncharacterized protein B0H64DRAFT_28524 [Chaetomium fimeti]|uniref:Uncharacterized protein n=1 Tax=Chaetomium fimeti TaxID=1854472 RepID=A0AAE0HQW9_9PEZI|nr:hypothetical protein B0H64DRAFT_28524 [Chaetomium fimeti]